MNSRPHSTWPFIDCIDTVENIGAHERPCARTHCLLCCYASAAVPVLPLWQVACHHMNLSAPASHAAHNTSSPACAQLLGALRYTRTPLATLPLAQLVAPPSVGPLSWPRRHGHPRSRCQLRCVGHDTAAQDAAAQDAAARDAAARDAAARDATARDAAS